MKGFLIFALMVIAALYPSALAAAREMTVAAKRELMHDYADCVVKRKYKRAAEAVIANVSQNTIQSDYKDLIIGDCLAKVGGSVQMQFDNDLYRYALADALVNHDFSVKGEVSFADRLPLAHLNQPDDAAYVEKIAKVKSKRYRDGLQKNMERNHIIVWLSRFGECVVRIEPVKTWLWLMTPPSGPEELSRINELMPAFSKCLKNGTLNFSRAVLRGTVAINYYRLAMASRMPVVSELP